MSDEFGNYQCILTPAPPDNPSGLPIGPGAASSIDYPGPPILTPPAIANIIVDSVGQQWMYWEGEWH